MGDYRTQLPLPRADDEPNDEVGLKKDGKGGKGDSSRRNCPDSTVVVSKNGEIGTQAAELRLPSRRQVSRS